MRSIRFCLVCVALVSGVNPLYAAETAPSTEVIPSHPMLSDDLILTLGVFYTRSTTSASLGPSSGGGGVAIDF